MTQQKRDSLVGGEALQQTLQEMKDVMPVLASEEDIRNIVRNYDHAEE
jgi:hypothetical protein